MAIGWVRGGHPARADHDRQAVDERPDHLEGDAAGADHDRRAQLQRGNPRRREGGADLLSAGQVAGEIAPGTKGPEVDDPANGACPSGGGERLCYLAFLTFEVASRAH